MRPLRRWEGPEREQMGGAAQMALDLRVPNPKGPVVVIDVGMNLRPPGFAASFDSQSLRSGSEANAS